MSADTAPLLSVRDLRIGFGVDGELAIAVDGVGFDVSAGETLGLVGESGCGKSMTLRSLIGLQSPGHVLAGRACFEGSDLLEMDANAMRRIRGLRIGMIFQDPTRALNPVMTIGDQIVELLQVKKGMARRAARARAAELLDHVGIPAPEQRMRDYPHQMSGGMRQRVTIAMVIALRPALVLADEPTTALDVTIQDQILTLLAELQAETQMAMILVSHDLGVIAESCERVAVMYAGHVVEYGAVRDVLTTPRHPYTQALLEALPVPEAALHQDRLTAIPGHPPDLTNKPSGCPFSPRCPVAQTECATIQLRWLDADATEHDAACLLVDRGER